MADSRLPGIDARGRFRLRHRRQGHDQPRFHVPLEIGRDGLGEGTVAYQEPGLNIPGQGIRREVRGRHKNLLAVLDDGLGVEDCPGAVIRVDGTWVVVDVRSQG